MPKFSNLNNNQHRNKNPYPNSIIGTPLGTVMGGLTLPHKSNPIINKPKIPPMELPGAGLLRATNYYADHGGCGWWRMIAPELLLNMNQKAIINGSTTMVLDPRFYAHTKSVRLQRQATPMQLNFVKFLKSHSKELGFKLIYEIDDIIFKDDIPVYNRCRKAFENPEILKSSMEMMQMCDEVSVTCETMKQYYMDKTGHKNITVIPNYPAKMWFDNHYNEDRLHKNYIQNKKQPRILYAGSGTHIDVENKANQQDDFHHVADFIIKTRYKFKWVFVGCFPLKCRPYIDNKEMEFRPWVPLSDLWRAYVDTNAVACFAPLTDCIFNRAKSNIKFLEAACCGVPGTFQDLVTYKDSLYKFTTGDDLINSLEHITKNESNYMNAVRKSREYADKMWLDDHLSEFWELYFTKIGDAERKELIRLNPDQYREIPKSFANSILVPN